jgi:NADH-quinone oxidoreductase subunit N
MAGIPPLAGFFGKLYIFLAAVQSGLVWLAVIGVLTSVIACFYYIKIVKIMYFDEPKPAFDMQPGAPTRWVLGICVLITVLYIVIPAPLVEAATRAAESLSR